MLAFLPVQYSHQPVAHCWNPESDDSSYYYKLAAQHQQHAELALARAKQARLQALRRQQMAEQNACLAQLYAQTFGHTYISRTSSAFPQSSYSPMEGVFNVRPAQLDASLEALKWREIQETKLQLRRHQKLRQAREQAFESWLESAVVGLARQPEVQAPYHPGYHRKAMRLSPIAPSTFTGPSNEILARKGDSRPEPSTATPALPISNVVPSNKAEHAEEFAVELWDALSSGRSDEEKEAILKAFGLPIPACTRKQKPEAAATSDSNTVTMEPPTSETPKDTSIATDEQERTKLLSAISTLENKFGSLKSSFEFPPQIDFDAVPGDSDSHSISSIASDTPSLPYTPGNKSLHTYENSLTDLLTKLDEIESHGFDEVRSNRKQLVRAIEVELESLDNKKVEAWLKQQEKEKAERLGDKIHIRWEPETLQSSPTTPSVALCEAVAPTEASTEDTKMDEISGNETRNMPNKVAPSLLETDSVGVEGHQSQETPEPTAGASIPNGAPEVASDEPTPSLQSALQIVGMEMEACDIPMSSDHHDLAPAESELEPNMALDDGRASPSTKRRSIAIEEVADDDFEML